MDKLLAKLSEQTAALSKQQEALKSSEDIAYARTVEYVSSSAPVPDTEVLRLKLELEAAKGKIARQEQELAQTRAQSSADSDFGYNPGESTRGRFSNTILTLKSFSTFCSPTSIYSR